MIYIMKFNIDKFININLMNNIFIKLGGVYSRKFSYPENSS